MISNRDFYDRSNNNGARSRIKNTKRYSKAHNFIKACLIEEYVPEESKLLDLGCGKGGDFMKLKRKRLSLYYGVDLSDVCINLAKERAINLQFPCSLKCDDFTNLKWQSCMFYDTVMAQFSIHYSFNSEKNATHVLQGIYDSLKEGGLFIGCIPHSKNKPYESVTLYDSEGNYTCEPCAGSELKEKCMEVGFQVDLWMPFNDFYNGAKVQFESLHKKMQVHHAPSYNWIFVFRKPSQAMDAATYDSVVRKSILPEGFIWADEA